MRTEQSEQCFATAKQYIPGGVNSPVRAFGAVGGTPRFIRRAKGSRIFDEDGNAYIDYVGSWGPCILGHGDDDVLQAVQDALADGLTFGAPTKKETALAALIREAYPAAEQVRLVSSGTEAVMSAVRVARGFTGKDKIIKCKGNYHGHSDGMLVKAGSGLLTDSVPDSAGVPKGYAASTLLADYNDKASVEALFQTHSDIAAVIVEPVVANMGVVPPKDGFLQFLREITTQHGALLIFDEVITGFRLAFGGAAAFYGVSPDLATFGKIVGGGMPLAAYGGRRDVMKVVAPLGAVYQAGTLSGNPIAVTAGLATLKKLQAHPEVYTALEEKAIRLETAFRERGLTVNRAGSLLGAFFTDKAVTCYNDVLRCNREAFARYFHKMLQNGVYVAPSPFEAMFLSAAHSDEDIEKTIKIIRRD